jgi:hypothetical protein
MNEHPPLPSLLDRAPSLPGLALADLTDDEREQGEGRALHPCGEFSAARFAALYPDRYETVARALAEGFSLEAAARVFHIHERTAAAIREREGRSLSAERYRGIQARHARAVVLAATDEVARRLREDPGAVSVRDLVAAARELHNIERSLEGAPTTIAGVIRSDGAAATLAALLEQAADDGGRSLDGFGRGKSAPREGPAPVPAVVVEVPALAACATESHTTESASACNFNGFYERDTGDDTRPGSAGAVSPAGSRVEEDRATGAGGVPREQGGPFRVDPSGPENFGSVNEEPAGVPAGA